MSERELYEATRGIWKVGGRRTAARYAFAIFDAVVREVYEINAWNPAGSTRYQTRSNEEVTKPGRWEFVGSRAPQKVRDIRRDIRQQVSLGRFAESHRVC